MRAVLCILRCLSVRFTLYRLCAFADFQLAFTPAHFRNERLAWRTIIQLNLIRCVSSRLTLLSCSAPPAGA